MANIPLDDLLKLPPAERAELAVALWDSLDDAADVLPLTEEQKAELDRRVAEHDADPSTAIPWEVVRQRLRQA
jgi:putative addiction module component (TIGR02574 family)